MPQTINVRVHSTITCAANDLVTVNLSGDTENAVYIKNTGPGSAWVSFDPTVPAAVSNVNCLVLKTGDSMTRNHVYRNQAFTLNADTAATVVTLSVSAYP
jgi:hypothetical protein